MLAKYSYLPYGQLNIGGGLPLDTGFTGHHWDPETGMYFAPFRNYMPGAGRWLTRDPLGFVDGPNVYGYVRNHPTVYVDTLGEQCGVWEVPSLIYIAGAIVSISVAWLFGVPEETKEELADTLASNIDYVAEALAGTSAALTESARKPSVRDWKEHVDYRNMPLDQRPMPWNPQGAPPEPIAIPRSERTVTMQRILEQIADFLTELQGISVNRPPSNPGEWVRCY